jgi:hypothetical protein
MVARRETSGKDIEENGALKVRHFFIQNIMALNLEKIFYSALNARQKENYNFQKVSAVLADYGFVTIKLSDDWQGADFIAQHIDGEKFLKIQLKGRLYFAKKYIGKNLHIAFFAKESWYLCPHDEALDLAIALGDFRSTKSWQEGGAYSFPAPSRELYRLLETYKIVGNVKPVPEDSMS